jgi:hypothetical protein
MAYLPSKWFDPARGSPSRGFLTHPLPLARFSRARVQVIAHFREVKAEYYSRQTVTRKYGYLDRDRDHDHDPLKVQHRVAEPSML